MSIFSERLSELMRLNELSQKDLASKSGVTESAMSYYVSGERTPRSDVLARIAKALNTTVDYLIGSTDVDSAPSDKIELQYIQRNLRKLNPDQLKKAESILKTVFDDIFDDEEE